MGSQYQASDSHIETLRKACRSREGSGEIDLANLEHTVALPGSGRYQPVCGPDAHASVSTPSASANVPALTYSIPAPSSSFSVSRQATTVRNARRDTPRVSFQLALTIAMLGATIGILFAQSVNIGKSASASSTPATTATVAAAPLAASAPAREPRSVVDEKTSMSGAVREKAKPKPAFYYAMPGRSSASSSSSAVAVAKSAPSSSAGPTAAETKQSLDALSEAQMMQTF